jgi:hypothetical protein
VTLPMQPGDVPAIYADIEDLGHAIGFKPATTSEEGTARSAKWFREYHKVCGKRFMVALPQTNSSRRGHRSSAWFFHPPC